MVQPDGGEISMGISIGATNTCAAVFNEQTQQVEILASAVGKNTTPSRIGFSTDGTVNVGERAHNQETYIEDPVRLVGDQSEDVVDLGDNGGTKTPTQLVSEIIKAVKGLAENKYEGKLAKKCVISVPSYFEDAQKTEIQTAATEANIEIMQFIDSASAAVRAAGAHLGEDEETVLVCDYGGSDLTVSVVQISFGKITDVKSECERNVGGSVLDKALVEHCIDKFKQTNAEAEIDEKARRRLEQTCQRAKVALSRLYS